MLELFLFIYHFMKSWMTCWGVLVDLDWMSVLAESVCACIHVQNVDVCNLVSVKYPEYTFLTSDLYLF